MTVRLLQDVDTVNGPAKAGDLIDHPDADKLVALQIAEWLSPGFPPTEFLQEADE